MNEYGFVLGIIGIGIGFAVSQWFRGKIASQRYEEAEKESKRIVEDARRRAETLLKEAQLEAKDKLFKMKSDFDAETSETRSEIKKQEKRLVAA